MRLPALIAALLLACTPAAAQTDFAARLAEHDLVLRDFRFASGERLPQLRIHYATLGTPRRDAAGRIVISTYPDRAKARNLRRNPAASVLVHSDEWDGPYVQVDGTAEVLDMPSQEAEDALVEYFRCISGEHPDWDEYREAMRRQGKSLIRITVDSWGPVATGGFPPDRAPA